jgi:hypothetical protein
MQRQPDRTIPNRLKGFSMATAIQPPPVPSASEAMCRFTGRTSDTMADLLDRYMASEEIVAGDITPEPTGEAFSALLRARMAFIRLPRVQQISFIRRLAEEYARCQMTRETQPHQA